MPTRIFFTEAELIIALKKHDNDAYKYLYLHYKGALYNVILQFVPDQDIANDVLQELFILIWKNIDKYDAEKGRLFTWLLRLTRNTAINKTRSKIYKSYQKNADLSDYVNTIDEKEAAYQQVNQIGLRKIVHSLREDYSAVLEMCYYSGFSQEETSKALNIPIGTVKTRLRNALIELRKKII